MAKYFLGFSLLFLDEIFVYFLMCVMTCGIQNRSLGWNILKKFW